MVIVCIDCRRPFPDAQALQQHREAKHGAPASASSRAAGSGASPTAVRLVEAHPLARVLRDTEGDLSGLAAKVDQNSQDIAVEGFRARMEAVLAPLGEALSRLGAHRPDCRALGEGYEAHFQAFKAVILPFKEEADRWAKNLQQRGRTLGGEPGIIQELRGGLEAYALRLEYAQLFLDSPEGSAPVPPGLTKKLHALQQLHQQLRGRVDHQSDQMKLLGEETLAFAARASTCSQGFQVLQEPTHRWREITVEREMPAGGEVDEKRIKHEVLEYQCKRCEATAPPDAEVNLYLDP